MNFSTSVNRISTHDLKTASDERECLLNDLHNLLEKLLQLAHQGNSTNEQFGDLTAKAGSLVGEIERTGILDLAELQDRCKELRALYEKLCLILVAQKANVHLELRQIHRGRKILGIYRSNI